MWCHSLPSNCVPFFCCEFVFWAKCRERLLVIFVYIWQLHMCPWTASFNETMYQSFRLKKQWPRLQSCTGMEFPIHSVSGFSRLNYDHPGYIIWFWPGFASAVALQDSGFQDVRAANRVEMDVKTTGDWMRVSLILCGFKEWCLRGICSCLGMSHQVL